jgi:antitoxin component YwqK of YwqJK toxin-antitoxin module
MTKDFLVRNLQRWSAYCPTGAKLLLTHEKTKNELPQDSTEEARAWFKSIELYNVSTLFVYGVGSGKSYLAAKDWLLENPEREIVFLEDDLNVIHNFLETETGTEFIFDNQAWLQYFDWNQGNGENKKEEGLSSLPFFLFLGDIQIACLPFYSVKRTIEYSQLLNHLQYLKNVKLWQLTEHIHLGKGFFKNFYRNLVDLPMSKLSDFMYQKFQGVPAIICGGGPSLDKNRELLETLKDRALIFGGGSAMNVLNETGFNPHFGVGIDPNWAQYARLTMNQAFTVPYFYRARMYSEALETIQGEHLFVRGAAGYDISSWAEEKIGLTGERLSEGNNVVNFSLAIAHALGCNPIIFVGVDLAYTQLASYSQGVLGHPLYDYGANLSTKAISEELLVKEDIYGKETFTLWKWVMESIWYTEYALGHPELTLINATEGGIGFEAVPNMTLAEVAEKHLTEKYDFDTWIHGEIQNSGMPETVNELNIIGTLGDLQASLAKCEDYCRKLRLEFDQMIRLHKNSAALPQNIFSETITENIEKLNQEVGYTYLLAQFNDSFMSFAGKNYEQIIVDELNEKDQLQAQVKKIVINKRRYEFLMSVCKYNRYQIDAIVREYAIRKAVSEIPGAEKLAPSSPKPFNDSMEEVKETFYQGGKIKARQGTRNGVFHGPSFFYGSEGQILAQSHYVDGKKEGEAWLFYASGEVYSLQNFEGDKWEGKQEFFFKNGVRKSHLNYSHGLLDGEVLLFHYNGNLYRSIFFTKGKRDGKEKLWNMGNFLEFEAEYKDNRPIGACRAWYPNGKIAREVIYDNECKACSIRQWNSDGTLLPEESLIREDYFNTITKQTEALTESLDNLYTQLVKVSPTIPEDSSKENTLGFDLKTDIEEVKLEMEKLHKMGEQMKEQEGNPDSGKESIWKTPSARRLMGKQLEEATKKMAEDINIMQEALKMASDLIKKNDKEKK